MKLVNTYYNFEVDILENYVTVMSVENHKAYAKLLEDIWQQIKGEEGSFILSDNEKIKNISKEVECIFNPFSLDCNSKKVITRLYQELKNQSESILQEDNIKLNCAILEYLERLIMTVPYNLKFNCDMDVAGVMKLYGVEIDNQGENLLEKIVEYIRVVSQMCNISIFVFVDIKNYLAKEELTELYKMVFYEKINMIIIEPTHTRKLEGEKSWIIDKDLCIIEL